VLERAHLRTVGDLHDADLDDVTPEGPMKRVWSAIEAAKEDPEWCDVRDWVRVGRSAYHAILRVQDSEPSFDVPPPFRCAISNEWMVNPVVAVPSGQSYERVNLERWIATAPRDLQGLVPDPVTQIPIAVFVPNWALRQAINHYRPLEERFVIQAIWE
jgi:hypothetical protein